MKILKRVLLALAILLALVMLSGVGLFTWLLITEYRPEAEEPLTVETPALRSGASALDGETFTVLSWNVGYCGLGRESDFFMDGGLQVQPQEAWVQKNLAGVQELLTAQGADFVLLQEVDSGSKRSCGLDQSAELSAALGGAWAYALNFSCKFVPYPWPPIGQVHSGLLTVSRYAMEEAVRVSLPCPFSWPVSMVNLKRCLLVSRVPIVGSEKELVLVNLHLEAYDDGAGKLAQSQQLRALLAEEYAKGNYVLAGGDWNQVFPDTETRYPNTHVELWAPGYLDEAELAEGWRYVWDESAPTCRLLNQPYDPADGVNTQYYVIDGFLVSPNLIPEAVETLDQQFACSDHNPVLLTLRIGE